MEKREKVKKLCLKKQQTSNSKKGYLYEEKEGIFESFI